MINKKSKDWIWNPKTKNSGIITCIPQKGECPNKCEDCFFQSGRSYLEPLDKNLPHIPIKKLTKNRIVRINDGNDSNVERELVEKVASKYDNYFFNTAIPIKLAMFSNPVVLTVNPGKMTNSSFHKLAKRPLNLMFIRIRVNSWNIESIVKSAVEYYTSMGVCVVLTFMAYYTTVIPQKHKRYYEWKKRTLNSYWVMKQNRVEQIMRLFKENGLVYSCGYKHTHACLFCGNCIREYYNTKERLKND